MSDDHKLYGTFEDTMVECPHTDESISAEDAEVFCPETIMSTWRYCPYCGEEL